MLPFQNGIFLEFVSGYGYQNKKQHLEQAALISQYGSESDTAHSVTGDFG